MKLSKSSRVFNAGDTSLRVKSIIEEYKEVLDLLHRFKEHTHTWTNKDQIEFEQQLYNLNRFKNREKTKCEGQRARTVTSMLYKIGFCDSMRNVSSVGSLLIGQERLQRTELEDIFDISDDSMIFLKQLLKFRVYDSVGQSYFYPFRILLKLLTIYDNIPKLDLMVIVHSVEPNWSQQKIEDIINSYSSVATRQIDFKTFYKNKFFSLRNTRNNNDFEFRNRKSGSMNQKYEKFLMSIERYSEDKTESNLKEMLKLSKDSAIKKAFGYGTYPFNIGSYKDVNNLTQEEFEAKNQENKLLHGSLLDKHEIFIDSKNFDLIKEYSDLTMRLMNCTGIITIDSTIVNVTYKEIFESFIDNIDLCGKDSFVEYDKINSTFYKNHPLDLILNNQKVNVESIITTLGCKSVNDLKEVIRNKKTTQFEEFVQKRFPINYIIDILQKISNREDDKVQQMVTTEASVPTIYEYVLGIAWYYISEKKVDLLSALNLQLDGSFLPLSHAPGGMPDMQFHQGDICVNIEATLSENYSQERMEVIPILTHTKGSVEKTGKRNLTIFVANNFSLNCLLYLDVLFNDQLHHEAALLPWTTEQIIKFLKKQTIADDIIRTVMNFRDEGVTFSDERFKVALDSL